MESASSPAPPFVLLTTDGVISTYGALGFLSGSRGKVSFPLRFFSEGLPGAAPWAAVISAATASALVSRSLSNSRRSRRYLPGAEPA